MRRLIALVLLVFFSFPYVSATPNKAPYYYLDFSVHGQKYRFELFLKELTGAPDWKMGDAEPPISPNSAYLKAKAALNESLPDLSDLRASQVTITRLLGEDEQYHTYYEFSFFSPDIDTVQMSGVQQFYRAPVVVLMDGRVISPHRVDPRKSGS